MKTGSNVFKTPAAFPPNFCRTAVALHVLHTETGFIQASGGEVSEKVNWPLQI